MTQRIFDVENEKDMTDLWDILPDECKRIVTYNGIFETCLGEKIYYNNIDFKHIIKINWHDKTEITRPIQEATEADIGKLCKFWYKNNESMFFGILERIDDVNDEECSFAKFYCMKNGNDFFHCRRLTKQEIEELI